MPIQGSASVLLDDEQCEALREFLRLLHKKYGTDYATMSKESSVSYEDIRNFVSGRSSRFRKSNTMSALVTYVSELKTIKQDPALDALRRKIHGEIVDDEHSGGSPLSAALAELLPVREHHFQEVAREYGGKYLTYRYSVRKSMITTAWLEINEYDGGSKIATFSSYQKPDTTPPVTNYGVVIPWKSKLYCIGARASTANLHLAILQTADVSELQFLHGIVLTTAVRGVTLAAKIYCKKLPDDSVRDRYEEMIGTFPEEDMRDVLAECGSFINNETTPGGVLKMIEEEG